MLQGKPQFVRIEELGCHGEVVRMEPVAQPDRQSVKDAGDLLVVGAVYLTMLSEHLRDS